MDELALTEWWDRDKQSWERYARWREGPGDDQWMERYLRWSEGGPHPCPGRPCLSIDRYLSARGKGPSSADSAAEICDACGGHVCSACQQAPVELMGSWCLECEEREAAAMRQERLDAENAYWDGLVEDARNLRGRFSVSDPPG